MRYAILSDIHGNLEAFHAVLDALSGERIDSYLSVGDVVSYGANPKECIKLLRSLEPKVLIAGNHEWGILGLKEPEYFVDMALEAMLWTKKILNEDELKYIRSFALTYEDKAMTLVHGTLDAPEDFRYIHDADGADVTISKMRSPLCFVGHTHVAGIFASDHNKVESMEASGKTKIDYNRRYVVNAGSIGQPRDGDARASYAIYDDEEGTVDMRRAEYDIKSAQKKILSTTLPPLFAYRLSEGK